ncbi:MAG TPA: serine/threonine-protein kinase [Candidatus Limnocylindrales bacterium]|nr:serine/threonine-protein kinase [Candidatus Limnocylindrales bacterium]
MLASTQLLAGRYRVLDPVGEGGMAIVYRAQDELLGREVAIKVLKPAQAADPDFVERFRREARHAAQLHHPNVVTIHDLGTDPATGADYIVMQLVHGPSLEALMADGAPLALGQALRIGSETADALQAAHDQGIVHRDVKPGNILVDADGSVRVADFGIARAAGAGSATTAGVVVGSPDYISPEQVIGDPVTPESDIYSLGVVLYQMTTGRRPFAGSSAAAVALQRLVWDPPSPASIADVPPEIDAIIRRAMARSPADRFPTAEALSAALEAFRVAHLGGIRRGGSHARTSELAWTPVGTAVASPIDPIDEADPIEPSDLFAGPVAPEVDYTGRITSTDPVPPPSRRRRRSIAILVPLIAVTVALLGAAALAGRRVDGPAIPRASAVIVTPAPSPVPPPVAVVPTASSVPTPSASPSPTAPPTPRPTPRATPRPTPAPTTAPTPQPTPPPTPAQRTAAETVRLFYARVARHDFDGAARLWSASMRQRYPPDRYIDGRFAATTGITVRRAETVSRSGDTARVAVDLLEYRSDSATRHWVGSWDLVRTSAGWLLNQPHF